VAGCVTDIALAPILLRNMAAMTALCWDRVLRVKVVTPTTVRYTVDTVLGERGALAVPNVVVDRVPGHARVPIHHPSMEAMTALRWDQVLNRKIATPTTVQFTVDTVPGDRGALAVSNVAVDRVPGHARAPVHHPSTEAMTALCWDRVLNRRIATFIVAVEVARLLNKFGLTVVIMGCQEKNALVKGAVTMTPFQKAYHIATTSAHSCL